MGERVFKVLLLCIGNAARSLIAEAILNREGAGRFRAFSGGTALAAEPCPQWRGQPMTAHWSLADPETFAGSETERAALVADIMRMLNTRIGIFCALPIRGLDRLALQRRLDAIGTDA